MNVFRELSDRRFRWSGRLGFASFLSCTSLYLSVRIGGTEAGPGVFPFLFPACVISAWTGGIPSGALATVILALGAAYYHLPPVGLAISDSTHLFALCAFVLSGLLLAWLVGALQYHRDLAKYTLLSVGDAVITTDRRCRVRVMNPLAETLTGWSKEEALGRPLAEILRVATASPGRNAGTLANTAMRERRVLTLPEDAVAVSKSGSERPLDDSVAPIQSHDGDIVGTVVVFRDATDRRRAEAARVQAESRYREIFEGAVVGMFQITPDGLYLRVNHAMAALHGYAAPQEMIDATTELSCQTDPDPAARRQFRRLLEETRVGNAFPLEVVRRDGTRLSTVVNARAVCDSSGRVLYYEGTQEDVTEQRRLQAQFEQAQKLEAVGRLASGVAHDFNNILSVISGCSELATHALDTGHPAAKHINQIREASARAARLTRQLLTFSRLHVIQPTVLDLNKVVGGLSHMLERLVGEDLLISFKPTAGLGLVMADPGQVEQILMNLTVNSRDAMPGGGTIKIETRNVDLDREYTKQHQSAKSGPYVMLSFSDTGHGIDEEILPHIFEPFFTTKELGKGNGLGLATVYGIVKQSGGNIWVYSEPGLGTTFKIYFPRVDVAEAPTVPEPASMPKGGTETIMLVEDDVALREIVSAMLEAVGYEVLKPENAIAALELAGTSSATFQLLLTDVIMPQMNGIELHDRMRTSRPGIKCLYLTGYAGSELTRRGLMKSDAIVLEKPFSSSALLASVRAVLDRDDS